MLEEVALQIGLIQNTLCPQIAHPHIVVFAADHGIAATGLVNPYPQAVTAQMVLNFISGGAAINVFCRQDNIGLTVVDAGVNVDFDPALPVIYAKIKKGTADYSKGNAMTEADVLWAIEKGKEIVQNIFDKGCNTIGFGEMGIGNTSSASLIMHCLTGIDLKDCIGRGTGLDDEQLRKKYEILNKALTNNKLDTRLPYEVLQTFGGFEIAMIAEGMLEAYEKKCIIMVDGFIATVAFLVAHKLKPTVIQHAIFCHQSDEKGHKLLLDYLHVKPLVNLNMRLGEGTGCAIAYPIIQSSVNFLNQMASFETAGVSNKD